MLIYIIHKRPHLDTCMTYIKKKEARIHLHLDFHNTKRHYRLRISIFILAHANDLSYMRNAIHLQDTFCDEEKWSEGGLSLCWS